MKILLKPKEQRFIKIDVPFIEQISGIALIKLPDLKTGCTNIIKVKFVRNTAFIDVTKIHHSHLYLIRMKQKAW